MRSFTLVSLVCSLLVLATLSAAWPWPSSGLQPHGMMLGRRADKETATQTGDSTATQTDSSKKTATQTDPPKKTATQTDSSKKTGTDTASATVTGTNTADSTGHTTGTAKATGTKKHKSTKTTISVDPRLPPGGIEMITPSAIAQPSYYKIGDYVTFKWNYTSLIVTPSAVNVVASCSLNQEIYTISSNMSVGPTGAVTWDTGKYQATATVPLLTASYTLIVYEVGKSITDVASAGHLGTTNRFVFGMYTPQPYTPLGPGYQCATCSGAMSDIERNGLRFAFGMITITVLSFTWFAGGFGVFST
ncbi:hypothetical protein VTN02DRAFT_1695 [Thermoascus thermophilus]